METKDVVTIIALILGPLCAVLITLLYQASQEKRRDKMSLFLQLMTHRKCYPSINEEWVNGLNQVDVVFHDYPSIVNLWHEYLDKLSQKDRNVEEENRKSLDLLLEIARVMGYKNLKQTDMDRFYAPVGLGTQKELSDGLQRETLQYMKNLNALFLKQSQQSVPPQTQ